jgi:hypothetical protein
MRSGWEEGLNEVYNALEMDSGSRQRRERPSMTMNAKSGS